MIKVFYGDNRLAATEAIKKFLGDNYEIMEGSELTPQDLPNLFWGTSLFGDERKILVRDFLDNRALHADLSQYLTTNHKVVFLELKVDKRSNIFKILKDKVEFTEFKMPQDENKGLVFEIYNMAKRDGKKAVAMVEKIEHTEDPIMFEGFMISRALKEYASHPGAKEKRALAELSKLDMNLKSSSIDAWTLIKAFLLT